MLTADQVLRLFEARGGSEYGGEQVTQLEHALQTAFLAEQAGATDALIVAALLHDIGHLLHDLPEHAPDEGIDDRHEQTGLEYLRNSFPAAVVEPVGLHVAAKRYLCAIDSEYMRQLSGPSVVSLELQGGPMSAEEVQRFRDHSYADEAVHLRRWDDQAKVAGLATPPLSHFQQYLRGVLEPDETANDA